MLRFVRPQLIEVNFINFTHCSVIWQLRQPACHHPKVCVWGVGGGSSSSSTSTPPKTCLCLGLFIDEINYKLTRNSPGRVTGSGGDRYG